jgi:hypothetical protein
MSNQGVQTRGKAKFGSVSAAAVVDAVVTNSARSVAEGTSIESAATKAGSKGGAEGTSIESAATKAGSKGGKVKGGEKKVSKESAIAGLPTNSTIDVFDFVEGESSKVVSVKASIKKEAGIKKEKVGGEKGSKTPPPVVAGLSKKVKAGRRKGSPSIGFDDTVWEATPSK